MDNPYGKGDNEDAGGRGNGPWLTGAYESWNYGRGAAYAALTVPLSEARYIHSLMELPPGITPEELAKSTADGEVRILLPLLWKGLPRRSQQRTAWPVVIDFGDPRKRGTLNARNMNQALFNLSQSALGTETEQPVFRLGAPLPTAAVSSLENNKLKNKARNIADPKVLVQLSKASRKLVVMAVIDDGIPFAHRNLLNEAGDSTRIEHCWLQSIDANGLPLYGTTFERADIDALRATHGPDEDAVYCRCGAIGDSADASPTLAHFASHGAHVLDAAAGHRIDEPNLDLMRIITVQLPAPVTIDTTPFGKSGPVLAAMHFIFEKADEIAQAYLGNANAPLPLVINFSYGFTGGPHDGSDPLEIAMAHLVATRKAAGKPTELVMPAGNSFSSRMLGEIAPDQLGIGKPFHIPWRQQPNDATPSYLELWLPISAATARYSLALSGPSSSAVSASTILEFEVTPGALAVATNLSLGGKIIGHADIAPFNSVWTLAYIALAPSEPRDAALPASPAGLWTVLLTRINGSMPDKAISCRIQRDSDPFGYQRGGRQSYFDDQADLCFTSDGAPSRIENPEGVFVRRLGTVNGLTTHSEVTVISSFFGDTGRATAYASAGPLNSGPGSVAGSMTADKSTALPGSLAAGTRSGSAIRLSGTSMAAPLYARRAAMKLMTGTSAPAVAHPVTVPVSNEEMSERSARLGWPHSS